MRDETDRRRDAPININLEIYIYMLPTEETIPSRASETMLPQALLFFICLIILLRPLPLLMLLLLLHLDLLSSRACFINWVIWPDLLV